MAADAPGEGLPERQAVHWRPIVDEHRLNRTAALWTATTTAHVVPFIGAGALLFAIQPLALPVTLASFAHAWVIPELYAHRGANVVKPKRSKAPAGAERVSVGLLGDLVGHEARDLHARTGLVLERGELGVWLVGPAGALLVRPGGRRVHCYCVRVNTRSGQGNGYQTGPATRPAVGRPHRPSPARAAQRRARVRHRREPRVLGRAVARAAASRPLGAPRARRRRPIGTGPRPQGHRVSRDSRPPGDGAFALVPAP